MDGSESMATLVPGPPGPPERSPATTNRENERKVLGFKLWKQRSLELPLNTWKTEKIVHSNPLSIRKASFSYHGLSLRVYLSRVTWCGAAKKLSLVWIYFNKDELNHHSRRLILRKDQMPAYYSILDCCFNMFHTAHQGARGSLRGLSTQLYVHSQQQQQAIRILKYLNKRTDTFGNISMQ